MYMKRLLSYCLITEVGIARMCIKYLPEISSPSGVGSLYLHTSG